jgi:D-alanyl-D-alanine carboxypeptidase
MNTVTHLTKSCSQLTVCLLILIVPLKGVSQDSLETKVDRYVMEQMQKSFTPGIGIAVIKDGNVLLKKGYGLCNVELAVFTDPNSVFQLLSITKQFTAAAVMLLIQSGKLSMDSPVSKYLEGLPSSWRTITIRQLLTHTSGIVDLTDVHPYFEQIREDAPPMQLIKPLYKLDLLFQPGTQWRYSNTNYFLLGLLIEKLSGQTYERFLEQSLFEPLHMYATKVNDSRDVIPYRVSGYHWLGENAELEPQMISGYHGRKNILQNAIYISPTRLWAAGGLVSSVNDLVKWDSALTNHLLINKKSYEQMIQPGRLLTGLEVNYGLGNELFVIHGHRVAGHQGGGMAFNTCYLRFDDDRVSVIVLCNQTTGPSKQMATHIASLIIPGLQYDDSIHTTVEEPKKITEIFKAIIDKASKGEVDQRLFAEEASETANFIKRAGADFFKKQGELLSIRFLEESREGGKHIYVYRTRFKNATVLWNLEMNKEGKVLAINPMPE